MAIGTPNQLATQTSQTSGQTSHTLNLGSGIAANTLVVVATYANAGYPTSVSATGGNTYTLVAQNSRSGDKYTSLFYFFYSGAPGAQTVTISIPSSNMTFARAWEVSGIDTSSQLDEVISGQGLSTSPSTGTTAATDTADEIVFVTIGTVDSSITSLTWPATTGYTTLGEQNNATRNHRAAYAYKIVSATGTQSAAATLGGSQGWAFPLGTFRADAGGGGGGVVRSRLVLGGVG